jgi:hypothetical protein
VSEASKEEEKFICRLGTIFRCRFWVVKEQRVRKRTNHGILEGKILFGYVFMLRKRHVFL